jgi:hypothetical protein
VSLIKVLLVTTSPDLKAEVVAEAVVARPDMVLVRGRSLFVTEAHSALNELPSSTPSGLILVSRSGETGDLIECWQTEHPRLVAVRLDVSDDLVHISVRDPQLDSLLNSLRGLVDDAGGGRPELVA